jgi:hypothetical protein
MGEADGYRQTEAQRRNHSECDLARAFHIDLQMT